MSVYSTLTVSKSKAIEKILQGIMLSSNEVLADLLFDMYGSEYLSNGFLHNFRVTNSSREPDDDVSWPTPGESF